MHFLEPAGFLNAPDLAGCKVNVLYAPLWVLRPAVGVWALKQPLCSHMHKITNESVFYMAPLMILMRGKEIMRPLEGLGHES